MIEGDRTPIEIWVEDDRDFGGGPGSSSKRGTAWNLDAEGNRGDVEVGRTERTDHPTAKGSANVTLVIHLNGEVYPEGTVIAKGALPYQDGDIRDGFLSISGGTGGHAGIRGVMQVESWNPKKYREQG